MNISKNTGIMISLEQPAFGKSIFFGSVLKDNGNNILIEVNDYYKLKLNNNYIHANRFNIIPSKNETTKSLSQYYSLAIEVYLIDDKTGIEIIVGRGYATLD